MSVPENIIEATAAYESWLRKKARVIEEDLQAKHKAMAKSTFSFLRATFYRWAQLWPKLCPNVVYTPEVLAVGDLHVENFGTWRDQEGRLIWGVNDFDESCPMPYANDLVRLATSVRLAIREEHLSCAPNKACDAVLEGYTQSIHNGGGALVLAEHNRWLRTITQNKRLYPARFWRKLEKQGALRTPLPSLLRKALAEDLPKMEVPSRFVHREAGLGSLGRQRYTQLCEWKGSLIAREAKPLLPSAWYWAREEDGDSRFWYEKIVEEAVRVPDPFLRVRKRWVLPRLAPDCSRIELNDLPKRRDELRLLYSMGWETANIHLGSSDEIRAVRRDLKARGKYWLRDAAIRMEEVTIAESKEWKHYWRNSR